MPRRPIGVGVSVLVGADVTEVAMEESEELDDESDKIEEASEPGEGGLE